MNKLLISLLSLTGVAGISTGGYFLLRNNEENSKNIQQETEPSGGGGESGVKSTETAAKPSGNGDVQAAAAA